MTTPPVLDACCGSRMMWFNKQNELALFADKRKEKAILCDGRALEINPDIQMDFTNMPFPDNTFHHVVFDPPHLKHAGATSWIAKKYGVLGQSWRDDLRMGFEECFRVLKPNGTLVFKWSEVQIKVKDILALTPHKPLYGHTTNKNKQRGTHWFTFIKTLNKPAK